MPGHRLRIGALGALGALVVSCGNGGNDDRGSWSDEPLPGDGGSGGSAASSGGPGSSGGSSGGAAGGADGGTGNAGVKVTCSAVTGSFGGLQMTSCVPDGMEGKTSAPAPLVIALHGYTQSAKEWRDTSLWHELGGRFGFYVVYPQALGNRAWYWYTTGRARGQADPAGIVAMVDKMKADHAIDPERVFVTGLSAGGYMTVAMLADYPDVFAAGASFSGGPYGCSAQCADSPGVASGQTVKSAFSSWWNDATKRKPRLMLFHGDQDGAVDPGNMPAAAQQWTSALGADATADNASLGLPTMLKGYPYKVYAKGSDPVVATVLLTGLGHGTPVDPGTAPDQGGFDPKPSKTMENNQLIKQDWTNTGTIYGPYYAAKFFGLVP